MNTPQIGDTRVRLGFIEEYVEKETRNLFPPIESETVLTWERKGLDEGARTVEIYSVTFEYRDASFKLAADERIINVETLTGATRMVWIERTIEEGQ